MKVESVPAKKLGSTTELWGGSFGALLASVGVELYKPGRRTVVYAVAAL